MRDQEEIFHRSYWASQRASVNGVPFRDALMDNLLRTSPEVARKILAGDQEAFRSTLLLSIDHLASVYRTGKPTAILQGVAHRQSRKARDIEPALYEHFLSALLQTVRAYDPEYSEEVEKAWEAVLGPGIEYLKRQY